MLKRTQNIAASADRMVKKVCIDCGTHLGQGLADISARLGVDATWIVHSFEANPCVYKIYAESGQRLDHVQYHNAAVVGGGDAEGGTVVVNVESPPGEGETGMGTSIISLDKWNPWDGKLRDNFKTAYAVKATRLSSFIKDNFEPGDYIAVKMDIEGAEYDVLEDMEASGALAYVDFLAVEFHAHFFTNADEMRERGKRVMESVAKHNIQFAQWY